MSSLTRADVLEAIMPHALVTALMASVLAVLAITPVHAADGAPGHARHHGGAHPHGWPAHRAVPAQPLSPRLWPSVRRWAPQISAASRLTGINPNIIGAVMEQESGGVPSVVSPGGAVGLMQVLPSTGMTLGCGGLFDPVTNIQCGGRYLAYLRDHWAHGDLRLMLAEYNGGPGNPQYGYADAVLSRL